MLSRIGKREDNKQNPKWYKEYARKIRSIVLKHYGGECQCCGEDKYEFLAIDHIKGGGNQHKKRIGKQSLSFMRWLIRNRFPKGFQTLCHNCNLSLAHYGFCPHRPEIKRKVLTRGVKAKT